ncbi:hypothetical protein [Haloarchaeobius amylolyticus]|uniref:hypothetical protein n=1 Tax=Haloarchaeobius amylolyticus TaxID=1198296 RepID=UPI00226F4762|nr:hypothetical protein [Haloarchaeobius amylolyticus]
MRFPSVSGENLEGDHFELPADFAGDPTLAVVSFQRWHQPAVESWLRAAKQLQGRYPGFEYYELPTLSHRHRLVKSVLPGGLSEGVPDATQRARTIRLYVDVSRFRQALGIRSVDTVHALLLAPDGTVRWRARGSCTRERANELRRAVRRASA